MIIIEGADCTGKTTLAETIALRLNGIVQHCSYNEAWNMEDYHRYILHNAGRLEQNAGIPVVIDRWALSEAAYGNVFRGGETYDTAALHNEARMAYNPVFIYCTHDYTDVLHQVASMERGEMFDENVSVKRQFDELIASGRYGTYLSYNMFENNMGDYITNVLQIGRAA